MYKGFERYKIETGSSEYSELVQKELFRLGYFWGFNIEKTTDPMYTEYLFLFTDENGRISYGVERYVYQIRDCKAITLSELQEMKDYDAKIIDFFNEKYIEIVGNSHFMDLQFVGNISIENNEFFCNITCDIYRKLETYEGEEAVGMNDGLYINNDFELHVNSMIINLYRNTEKDLEDCFVSQQLENQLIEILKSKIKFVW